MEDTLKFHKFQTNSSRFIYLILFNTLDGFAVKFMDEKVYMYLIDEKNHKWKNWGLRA